MLKDMWLKLDAYTLSATDRNERSINVRNEWGGYSRRLGMTVFTGETFTVNRLRLTPQLMRCLATTNIIKNPNGAVRRVTHRVCRYRDAQMALRWTAAGFLKAEKSFRRIQGHKDLWILATALGRNVAHVDSKGKAA